MTPGNPLRFAYLNRLANPGVEPPESLRFDLATPCFLDDNLNPAILNAKDLIAVARALKLVVPVAG